MNTVMIIIFINFIDFVSFIIALESFHKTKECFGYLLGLLYEVR